ncbi:MAG: alpha/beta hydrolase [Pirellulaceae bacterium]
MRNTNSLLYLAGTLLAVVSIADGTCAQQHTLKVWPDAPPGRIAAVGQEADTSNESSNQVAGKPVIRLGNVSQPTIAVFSPPADKNTGAAVLVCPGGGYNILAYDLEGTEVCHWLNSIGITGVVLKYRVPRPEGEARPIEPLQDAQRALSLVRENAKTWGIQPNRIGVLGFSAGGNLAARLSTNYQQRAYPAIDAVDQVSCRPDFALLIYPAYLFEKDKEDLVASDLPLDDKVPPTFMTMANDDRVDSENVLRYALGLKRANVPVALHLFSRGGHGFGLRETDVAATHWPKLAAKWLQEIGL